MYQPGDSFMTVEFNSVPELCLFRKLLVVKYEQFRLKECQPPSLSDMGFWG